MTIFNFLELIGGLALFLFGMHILGESISVISGGKMEQLLEKLSSTKIKGLFLGALVTAVIQSSSATTVMVVALVNSGVMKLRQAVPIIMGANIGTTATGWILSLSGISGDSFFIQMLKPASFTPILAMAGIILIFTGAPQGKKAVGNALLGFSILMFGMGTMSGSVAPLQHDPAFQEAFQVFTNPFLGVLMGALLTAIIQSSSATTGILQALSTTGAITFASAIPLIMGQNIGTCITAIISTIGANKNAKRAAFIHFAFNAIGTLIFMSLFYGVHAVIDFSFYNDSVNEVSIALVHTIFNVVTVLFLFPFSDRLVSLSMRAIPSSESKSPKDDFAENLRLLDDRFLERPGFAIEQAFTFLNHMMVVAGRVVHGSLDLLSNYNKEVHEEVKALERQVDRYEKALLDYTLKITGSSLNRVDNDKLTIILHTITDIERIGDYAFKISNQAKEKAEAPTCFSDQAEEELAYYGQAVRDIIDKTQMSLINLDLKGSVEVHVLEDCIDRINKVLAEKHIDRLQAGICNVQNGMNIAEIYNAFERIGDHCQNLAAYIYDFSDQHNKHPGFQSEMDPTNPDYLDILEKKKESYLNAHVLKT